MITHAQSIDFKTFVESFFQIIFDSKNLRLGYSTQCSDKELLDWVKFIN
jgi:hypothetical protein